MGLLITFEGIDKSGKETQSKRLSDYLSSKEIPNLRFSYPDYSSATGRFIRDYLSGNTDFDVNTQVLFYAADIVKDTPSIMTMLLNCHVICDRYFFGSTIAYQSAKGFSIKKLLGLAELFQIPKPDYTFLLDISPETSSKRKGKMIDADRHEKDLQLLARVREQFLTLHHEEKLFARQSYLIDGERSSDEIFSEILSHLSKGIPNLL